MPKRTYSRVIPVLVSLALPILIFAQLPCNTYGGAQDERCYGLVEAVNGGWVLGGWTKSFGPGAPAFENLLVVKVDAGGVPLKALMSVGPFDEEIRSMDRTADGGYVMCGWTKSPSIGPPGNANIIVVKADSQLNVQWAHVFGDSLGDEYAYSVVADPMGNGCTVCGYTSAPTWGPAPYPNILVMKLSAVGLPVWTRVYWNPLRPLLEEAYGLTRIMPGPSGLGYVVVGRWGAPGLDTLWDGFVLRVDSEGIPIQPLPVRVIPGANNEEAWSVVQSPLDPIGYAVAGWTNSWGPGVPHANIWVVKFSEMGNPVPWRKVYGWPADDEKLMDDRSLIATMDKGYAFCGWTQSQGPGAPPMPNDLIVKLDSLGGLLWTRVHPSIPGAMAEEAFPMIRNQQGTYAIAGFTASFGVGLEDFHFLTLDQFGNRPACVDSPPVPRDTLPVVFDTIVVNPVVPLTAEIPLVDTFVWSTEVCPLTGIKNEIRRTDLPSGVRVIAGLSPEIQLFVPVASHNILRLLDAGGRQLAVLANGWYDVGRYTFKLPGGIASGVYYLDAVARGRRQTVKAIRF